MEEHRATRAVHRVHLMSTRPTIAIVVAAAVIAMWIVIAVSGFDQDLQLVFATVSAGITLTMVFVLQHTIHHQALVALLLAARGVAVPHTFGYAPSTPRTAA